MSDDTSSVLLVPMSDEAVISTLQTDLIKRDDSDDKSKLQYLVDTDNKPNDDDGFLMMMMLKFKTLQETVHGVHQMLH